MLSLFPKPRLKPPKPQILLLQITTHQAPPYSSSASSSPPRLLVVQPRLRPDSLLHSKLSEALSLANSLQDQRDGYFHTPSPPHVVVQNPILRSSKSRADTYFGPGTVDTVKCHLNAWDSNDEVDAVFVNSNLTGVQQRNLERAWGKPVLDRVGLIIEIFNAHAHTKEAKLQAELAALSYKKSRLVRVRGLDGRYTFGETGEAEVVSARGRGSGGRGFISGAGETELQLQRRRILERRNTLLAQIEEVRRSRAVQRASRRRHGGVHDQGLATVAVVGYTNAGKSTLVSALTDSDLYSDSQLFATLDPRLKSVVLPSGRKVLLSDTVGFISDLPVQLVEAFHATLEEVVEADLLLHVVDCTAPNLDEQHATVLQVLQQIGVSEEKLQNMIEVWNKIDCEKRNEEHLNDNDCDDASSLSENEMDDELTLEHQRGAECGEASVLSGSEKSEGEIEEMVDNEVDYSQDMYLSGEEQEMVGEHWLKTVNDIQGRDSASNDMSKEFQSRVHRDPHAKISAIKRVGLQELLELVDERLKRQEEKLKAQNVVERSVFDRKWRPPKTKDVEGAV